MFEQRPTNPRAPNRDEPITSEFLKSISKMAGYFEGYPVNPTLPATSIGIGKSIPIIIKEVDDTVAQAFDNSPNSAMYWVTRAGVIGGAQSGALTDGDYVPSELDETIYRAFNLNEYKNIGARLRVGLCAYAFPVSITDGTTTTTVYFFSRENEPIHVVPEMNSVLIAGRKWDYTFAQWEVDDSGDWVATTYGITNETEGFQLAKNMAEAPNTAGATMQGNGLDMNEEPFITIMPDKLQPVRGGAPTPLIVKWSTDGTPWYWINVLNVAQEDCGAA